MVWFAMTFFHVIDDLQRAGPTVLRELLATSFNRSQRESNAGNVDNKETIKTTDSPMVF